MSMGPIETGIGKELARAADDDRSLASAPDADRRRTSSAGTF
jgi:hypothetical protein